MRIVTLLLVVTCLPAAALAQATWDLKALSEPPAVHEAPGFESEGVRALFYDGPPWKGKPTRVFAWYGAPASATEEPVPAMVLVHGGGGTALADWVRLWTGRGFAAIAMDLCGCVPRRSEKGWERHEHGGPPGWGGFDQVEWPEADQWTHHAVADVVLGHSLLRSQPEVSPEKIGVTGISWGGYLTCIVSSVDSRFRFAAPVYGCGFLGENSAWLKTFEDMGEEKARRWLDLWDPSRHLPKTRMPMLWVNGTNDFAYPLDSYQKSYRLPAGPRTLAIRIEMPHAHGGPGENPEEIHGFASAHLKGAKPLARITAQGVSEEGHRAWAKFEAQVPIVRAELAFTRDKGTWQSRKWKSVPAESAEGRVSAAVPDGATVFFINLFDERGCVVSTEHVEVAGSGEDPDSRKESTPIEQARN